MSRPVSAAPPFHWPNVVLAGIAALLLSQPAASQARETIRVTAEGPAPATALSATAAGQNLRIVGAEAIDPRTQPWEIVLYLDTAVSSRAAVQRVADQLIERVTALTALGEVEIVVADSLPRTIQPPTRDPEFLLPALERLSVRAEAEDAVRSRRQSFWLRLEERRRSARRGTGAAKENLPMALARSALSEEVTMRRLQHDALLSWLGDRGPAGERPRLLLLLSEPIGQDPIAFLNHHLNDDGDASQLAPLTRALPDPEDFGRALAAYGWVTVPLGLGGESDAKNALQYKPSAQLPVGFSIRLGRTPEPAEPQLDLMMDEPQHGALETVAALTGGRVISDPESFGETLARATRRVAIDLEVPPTAPEAGIGETALAVTSENGALRAPAVTTFGQTPESVAVARLRLALYGQDGDGELEIDSVVELDPEKVAEIPSRLVAETRLGRGTPGARPLRISVAVSTADDRFITRHSLLSSEQLASPAPGIARFEEALQLPGDTEATLVLVEALDTGEWGLAWADIVEARPQAAGPLADRSVGRDAQQAGDRAIRLEPETPSPRVGRIVFTADTRQDVARVQFLVDREAVAERNRPPFRARINLGNSGRPMEVTAIAFDADGFELDRDTLRINEPADAFWVRVTEPRPGRRVGRVPVAVDVKAPDDGEVARVDFYWNADRQASAEAAPWRGQIFVPVNQPDGYVRAVATLTDGRTAEDVVLMNRPGFGTQIGVQLVELYVVATDKSGVPVTGLEREDFEVREDGEPQEIETFAAAGDLPLTIGLAIDTSSSLFLRMPAVQRASRDFTRSLISNRDRAFLVEFGQEPRLVQRTTTNLNAIVDGISSFEPQGTTPVWEAVALSLEELAPVRGRRALVVFYDGDDEDLDFSYRRALSLARKTEVPIYLMVMNDAAARSEGRSFKARSFVSRLERMASAGGGRVYYLSTEEDLDRVFRAIGDELRSHYLLTYYPQSAAGGPQWREVEVDIQRRGIDARTIEGYGTPQP